MSDSLPVVNAEFVGLSDGVALRAEVDNLRGQLALVTEQLALERQAVDQIHQARTEVLMTSPALQLVFKEELESTDLPPIDTQSLMRNAFQRDVEVSDVADGFADTVAKELRTRSHTDTGGEAEAAQTVAGALSTIDTDAAFSIATALLAASSDDADPQALRDERSRLHLALAGSVPIFDSIGELEERTQKEVESADWRLRAEAAIKTMELLIGEPQRLQQFLESIVREHKVELIQLVNRALPAMFSLRERIDKGDPIRKGQLDIETIDSVLQRIWSALGESTYYSPPAQGWFDIFLPALQALDPGPKEGESYTNFRPPIEYHTPYPPVQRNLRNQSPSRLGGLATKQNFEKNSMNDLSYYQEKNY